MRATKDQLEAIISLRNDRNFQQFLMMVGAEVEQLNQLLIERDHDTDKLNRLVGQLRFGAQLIKVIETAPAERAKMDQPRT